MRHVYTSIQAQSHEPPGIVAATLPAWYYPSNMCGEIVAGYTALSRSPNCLAS